jgi:ATP-dependent helicase HrpB
LKAFADTLVEIRGDRALPREASAEALLFRSAHPGESRYAVVLATAPAGREGPSSMVTLYQSVSSESLWQELLEELQEDQRLEWDAKSRSVKAVRRTTLGALIIDEEVVAAPAGAAVADLLYQNLSAADFGEDFAALCRRLERFLEARPELAEQLSERVIPVGQQGLLPRLILGYLQSLTRWGKGAPEGLLEHVQSHLGYQTLKALESALPTSVKLPGRQRPVAVHYPEQGSPFVASKLQDFFGWKPPLLLDGRLRLACHLLAPSGRPVQITEDLEGFWKGSYQQVRKDLRGRYPKHAWPENP